MEEFPNFEQREREIDELISQLAEREGMTSEDMLSDIIVFAPHEENETANPDYIDEVAERIGISVQEMRRYAIKKAKDYQQSE